MSTKDLGLYRICDCVNNGFEFEAFHGSFSSSLEFAYAYCWCWICWCWICWFSFATPAAGVTYWPCSWAVIYRNPPCGLRTVYRGVESAGCCTEKCYQDEAVAVITPGSGTSVTIRIIFLEIYRFLNFGSGISSKYPAGTMVIVGFLFFGCFFGATKLEWNISSCGLMVERTRSSHSFSGSCFLLIPNVCSFKNLS